MRNFIATAFLLLLLMPVLGYSFNYNFSELVGYTMVGQSTVVGEFEGAAFDKLIELDNGMIFKFNEYSYTYSYRPDVDIFAKSYSIKTNSVLNEVVLCKLLINNEIYDAYRVK
jgi:hypothetical protein